MARILVSGYYGFGNAGDEAILSAIVRGLAGHRLCVLSGDPEATRREHGVDAVPRTHPGALAAAVARSDLVLSGGGSLLQDATGPWSVPYYLGVLWLARRLGRPFVVYAQGVGPVSSPWRFRLLRLLDHARHITVRDEASAELLLRAGVRRPPLEVTADAALALPRPAAQPARAPLRRHGLPDAPPVFAFSVRPWQGSPSAAAIAAAADRLHRRHGGSVILVPMQFPEDLAACEAVVARMRAPAAVVRSRLATTEWLELFACFDLVVGMRLHALIFAALAGAVPVGLSYDPKVDAFVAAVGGLPPLDVRALTADGLLDRLAAAFPPSAALRGELERRVAALQAAARRNDEVVRGLLGAPADAARC
jgi:polysaccharide pyruvyl transferase CsaB